VSLLFVFALAAFAQVQPTNFIATGAAYNGASGNGWLSYGKSLGGGFYSWTSYDVSLVSRTPLKFQYSVRTGGGFDLVSLVPSLSFGGRVHLIELIDAGAAANYDAVGFAFSPLGGFGAVDLGARFRHLHIVGGGRVLKTTEGTSTIAEVGVLYPF
jgi:hypothetical protein